MKKVMISVFVTIVVLASCEAKHVGTSVTPVKQSVIVGTYLPPIESQGK